MSQVQEQTNNAKERYKERERESIGCTRCVMRAASNLNLLDTNATKLARLLSTCISANISNLAQLFQEICRFVSQFGVVGRLLAKEKYKIEKEREREKHILKATNQINDLCKWLFNPLLLLSAKVYLTAGAMRRLTAT